MTKHVRREELQTLFEKLCADAASTQDAAKRAAASAASAEESAEAVRSKFKMFSKLLAS